MILTRVVIPGYNGEMIPTQDTDETTPISCTAFEGSTRIASGDLESVAAATKNVVDQNRTLPILIFDDTTSRLVEMDFRGTADEVRTRIREQSSRTQGDARSAALDHEAPRGPGRPRLGVVAREVTLLPRHWDWLNEQPGGASAALRRLVDEARRANVDRDRVRRARESAYRFMSAMAGNEPGFEEATRALFAGNEARFDECVVHWPADVRDHARKIAFFTGPAVRQAAGGSSA
jgi:hypothetical protein